MCSYFEGRRCSANGAIGRSGQRVRRAKLAATEDSDASSTASTESGGSVTPPSTAEPAMGRPIPLVLLSSHRSVPDSPSPVLYAGRPTSHASSPTEERLQRRRRLPPTARIRLPPLSFEAYEFGQHRSEPETSALPLSAHDGWASWSPFELAPPPAPAPAPSQSTSAVDFAVLSSASLPSSPELAEPRVSRADARFDDSTLAYPETADFAANLDEIGPLENIDSLVASVLFPPAAALPVLDHEPLYSWTANEPSSAPPCESDLAFGDAFLPTAHDYAQTLSLPLFSSTQFA